MAILQERGEGSRVRDPGFRGGRTQRYFKDVKEQDIRPDIGSPQTQGHYKATKKAFGDIDKSARDYYSSASQNIESSAGRARESAEGIHADIPKFETPGTVPVKVTMYEKERTDFYSDNKVTPEIYEPGGTYYFDSGSAGNIANKFGSNKHVKEVRPIKGGGYELIIHREDHGYPVAQEFMKSLGDAQAAYDQRLQGARSEYDKNAATSERIAAAQKDAMMKNIGTTERESYQMARERRDAILAEKDRIKNELKVGWERRKKVNSETINALLESGVLRKRGTVKNG